MALQVPRYIRSIIPYVPGKPIEETQREYQIKKVIKLASNENPLGPSPKAVRAIQTQLNELHRYPDASGFRLKSELAERLQISSSSLILGNGSNEIIDQLIRTFCIPGDEMVTSQGAFIAYKLCAQIHGVKTREARLNLELKCDVGEIAELARKNKRVRIIFVANPNNPTGTYLSTLEIKRLLKELASIRGGSVILVLDYAYWEYATASDLPDPVLFLKKYPHLVILRTFSKIYGLAGLRVGYGIASAELIGHLEKVRQPFNVSLPAQVAAVAALTDLGFVKKSRQMNLQGMSFWEKNLEKMSIPFWKSQGNFILADVQKGLGKSGTEVYQDCLHQGVIFRPVANYGLLGALRITVGTPEENERGARVLAPKGARKRRS